MLQTTTTFLVTITSFLTLVLCANSPVVPFAQVTSPLSLVYDYKIDRCITTCCDITDSPLRFWWNGTSIRVLASLDIGSRGFIGTSIDTLSHTCTVTANSTFDMNMANFADHEWVHSTWFFPENNTLIALTHEEYHCDRIGCPIWPTQSGSFLTGVTLFQSKDDGNSWNAIVPPPAHIVSVLPYQWNLTINALPGNVGFRSPSTILATRGDLEGWYYASVTAMWGFNALGQQSGSCMMRTRDVHNPQSWRAWNGSDFVVDLSTNPYNGPLDPTVHYCIPFTNSTYGTLVWSSLYNRYMFFGTNEGNDDTGWMFLLSDDLQEWDSLTRIDVGNFISLNGTISGPPPGSSLSGRFIQRNDSSLDVFWQQNNTYIRKYVRSCTPCPGFNACSNIVRLSPTEFDNLTVGNDFSCADVGFTASGTSHLYYPTLVTSNISLSMLHPNFDEVGASARLFLVASQCASINDNDGSGDLTCSEWSSDGNLVRNIVSAEIQFTSVTIPPCSLNGVLNGTTCICDAGWSGIACSILDLLPSAPLSADSQTYFHPSNGGLNGGGFISNSWGISVARDDSNETLWHGFMTEMMLNCSLSSWTTASHVLHMTAPSPQGPWSVAGVALHKFAHNPQVIRGTDGSWLLFHIGSQTPASCEGPGEACPGGHHDPACDGSQGTSIAHSMSPWGPWERESFILPDNETNPSALLLSDGTIAVTARRWENGVPTYTANSWNGPYIAAPRAPVILVRSGIPASDPYSPFDEDPCKFYFAFSFPNINVFCKYALLTLLLLLLLTLNFYPFFSLISRF